MPFKIQRVPFGLQNLLALSGGDGPTELEDRVRGVLDLTQLYGLQQLQSASASNAALAEGGAGISVVLNPTQWTVLFSASAFVVKTATMTALRARVVANRRTAQSHITAVDQLGPFGATETGTVNVGGLLPYPLICPPGSFVAAVLEILGTDATAFVGINAEFGVLSA